MSRLKYKSEQFSPVHIPSVNAMSKDCSTYSVKFICRLIYKSEQFSPDHIIGIGKEFLTQVPAIVCWSESER